MPSPPANILIYLLRHDLRVSDNPLLHYLATSPGHGFTHLLPVYVFQAQQIEISGFIRDGDKSPYPEARSQVGRFMRCGPKRATFIAQSVWNIKQSFDTLGSGLSIQAGMFGDVVQNLIQGLSDNGQKVGAVWMTAEEAVEEQTDERAVALVCSKHGVEFKTWLDEKYFVDDRDLALQEPGELPDVFTTYRKTQEPLRDRPRATVPRPLKSSLPPYPEQSWLPAGLAPFEIPNSYEELEKALLAPLDNLLSNPPEYPENAKSVHPFDGGEDKAQERLHHLVKSGAMSTYKDTRNGLLGVDFSTKLSAWLAMGCITARQVHEELVKMEDGTDEVFKDAQGYGEGENEGTKAVRFELLWRDYMRLCTKKFRHKLFALSGFRDDNKDRWKSATFTNNGQATQEDERGLTCEVGRILQRFLSGTTGMGLIDASQREIYHTGYTSNRARQNVASFLAKHLGIDWRYGAEWYECFLVDYDVSSNWSNWQYVAGVGNDPRGEARIFNPVKQAFDYDKQGEYVKTWVPEVQGLEKLENIFQPWTTAPEDLERLGLKDLLMVTDPIKRIDFCVDGKPKNPRRPYMRRRGRVNGNNGGGGGGSVEGHSPEPNSPGVSRSPPASGPPRFDGPNYRGNAGYRGGYRGGRGRGGWEYRGYRGRGGGPAARGAYNSGYNSAYYAPVDVTFNQPRPQWTTANPGYQM